MRSLALLCFICLALPLPLRAESLDVLVSIPPAAWFVRQVAGDAAEVKVMVPPGASPHVYEPKPGQMAQVARADLYLAIGVEFEKVWLPRFRGVNPKLAVARLDEGIVKLPMAEHHHHGEEEHGPDQGSHQESGYREMQDHGRGGGRMAADHDDHEGDHRGEMEEHHDHEGEHRGGLDPHVWLSPRLALSLVDNAERALAHARPGQADLFAANARRTRETVAALGRELEPLFADLPSRRFMVFHPSWGYFAHEYDLIQMPIETQGREPSPRELHDLLSEAREHGVKAVFVQPQMSRRTASIVAGELSGRVVVADPLAADWAENLRRVAREMAAAMRQER